MSKSQNWSNKKPSKERSFKQSKGKVQYVSSPFAHWKGNILYTIKKHYNVSASQEDKLLSIIESWQVDSLSDHMFKMSALISQLSPKADDDEEQEGGRGDYKAGVIKSLLGNNVTVSRILDIGAGKGEVLRSVKKLTGAKEAYSLEVQSFSNQPDEYERIKYNEDGTIPLKDGSIDLVIMLETLHHINPEDREPLLNEVKRILSPKGCVVIQEHDFDNTAGLHIALEVIHSFWYVKENEELDPLYLMTQKSCNAMFESAGLFSTSSIRPKGWQRIYWSLYSVPLEEEVSLEDSLFITHNSKKLHYNQNATGKQSSKNGQLKLFLSCLQALVTFWDRELVPYLTVVYAGSAPGMTISNIDSLFPGRISWHLYDTTEHFLGKIEDVTVYNQYFTDEDALEWSKVPNVFFFSDIRREGASKASMKLGVVDTEHIKSVQEDMDMQMKWVKIMKPYQASLKFRLPFDEGYTNYLDSNIMFQSFNKSLSAETRLIPIKVPLANGSQCDYVMKSYSNKEYEETLFYHNRVTKEASTMEIEPTEYIKDTYEYAHLLHVLDMLGEDDPIGLATEVIKDIDSAKTMVYPRWNNDKNLIKEYNSGTNLGEMTVIFDRDQSALERRLVHIGLLKYT